ncbi:MAG: hypothetical protein PWP24_1500 [Clostridiales bacterium]|nr:hypothetical protein [Clostridiales bacterium]
MSCLQIAVCEDEPAVLRHITKIITFEFQIQEKEAAIRPYKNPEHLVLDIKRGMQFHVLFLDIDMPNINGLELAAMVNRLSVSPLIVFVSSMEELVYQSFRVHPFRFLPKASFPQEIHTCISDILEEFKSPHLQDFIVFSSQNTLYRLNVQEILYVECIGKTLRFAMHEKTLEVKYVLSDMEQLLSPHHFLRIHKSYLVNRAYIYQIETREIRLSNGTLLPLSRYRAKEIKQKFQEIFLCSTY